MAKLPTPTYEQAWSKYHAAREKYESAERTYLEARKAYARSPLGLGLEEALVAARKDREAADTALRAAETLLQGM